MTKQEIRKQLSLYFLQELRNVMKDDPSIEVVNIQLFLVRDPNYNKVGSFRINLLTKPATL